MNQDIQWYIKDTGDLVSISLILAAFFVYVTSTRMKIVAGSFFLISIIDIWHYWLWFKRNEHVVILEFIIVIIAGALMMFKYKQRP